MSNILCEFPYNDHKHIALVKLNRPKVLNALSTDLMRELVDKLFELDDNPEVRVIILTGNDRAFAAGADIAQMVEATPIDQINDNRFRSWQQLAQITKPIIAAVNGYALGGGCELAMHCDFIIAGDSAKFGQPEIKIGTTPGAGGTQRLTRAIGKSKAMMLAMTGEMIEAKQALDWGLVAKVVPSTTLMQETYETAKNIANKAPVAIKLIKESVNKAFEMSLSDGVDFERRNFYLTFSSSDQKEGMRAFLEKRDPEYKGN
ncbi:MULTISPECIES: enoyl-CoA hydratase-related protein [unclassified Halobacteriovorax]|uniref:enoyl-CoA hydratase-related protein n=1 Tax=unclassified Halobacteriovorax TaxID=2639665 RepID=UPI000EA21E4D|nr:enoyl-CoA hydratase-related protein [Halobacteriovorax sp. BALOs_7]AYF44957.1 enoyl-CoA hydratase/isomerase family protein [Halobacteriovorax sp. BALOs_7]